MIGQTISHRALWMPAVNATSEESRDKDTGSFAAMRVFRRLCSEFRAESHRELAVHP
jgi:hypothetical protein